MAKGLNFATLPKKEFPGLLLQLLQKDYSTSIVSGFEATGLYPASVQRALTKLPAEHREVQSAVEQQLLNTLSEMRYNPGKTTCAERPRKKDKLPPGASYSSTPAGLRVNPAAGEEEEDEVEEMEDEVGVRSDSGADSDSSDDLEQALSSGESDIEEAFESVSVSGGGEAERNRRAEEASSRAKEKKRAEESSKAKEKRSWCAHAQEDFPVGSYVVAIYQGEDWYVGQVLDKAVEPEADKNDLYFFVNFMEKGKGDVLKWPVKLDMLNMLESDILFMCEPPLPVSSSSSSRSVSFTLNKAELKKAKHMFMLSKAYYLNKTLFFCNIFWLSSKVVKGLVPTKFVEIIMPLIF